MKTFSLKTVLIGFCAGLCLFAGLYALAIFGLMAAIVAALCVRETPVALAPQALEAAAGD